MTQGTLSLAGRVSVACCYCGTRQTAAEPPTLHRCTSCGRDFRVYMNAAKGPVMEIGAAAKRFFNEKPPKSA